MVQGLRFNRRRATKRQRKVDAALPVRHGEAQEREEVSDLLGSFSGREEAFLALCVVAHHLYVEGADLGEGAAVRRLDPFFESAERDEQTDGGERGVFEPVQGGDGVLAVLRRDVCYLCARRRGGYLTCWTTCRAQL